MKKYGILFLLFFICLGLFSCDSTVSSNSSKSNSTEASKKDKENKNENDKKSEDNKNDENNEDNNKNENDKKSDDNNEDNEEDGNFFTDTRDGKKYPTAEINGKTWMMKNFAYDYKNNDASIKAATHFTDREGNPTRINQEYPILGRVYTLQAALAIAPTGWRLPTQDEWKKLRDYYEQEEKKSATEKFNFQFNTLASCSKKTGGISCSSGWLHFWAKDNKSVIFDNSFFNNDLTKPIASYFFMVRYVKE